MNLHDETLSLLKADTRSRERIAQEAGLTYSWISKFATGQIQNPGIRKIQTLNDYLNGTHRNHQALRQRTRPR